MGFEKYLDKFIDQSPSLAMVVIVTVVFARYAVAWVKEQIAHERENTQAEREDKNKCFEMHDALRECIANNTDATKSLSRATEANTEAIKELRAAQFGFGAHQNGHHAQRVA